MHWFRLTRALGGAARRESRAGVRVPFEGADGARRARRASLVFWLGLTAVALGVGQGCGPTDSRSGETPNTDRSSGPATPPLPGTARAAAALAEIYQEALREPMRYGHLNHARAEALRAEVDRRTGAERFRVRFQYASELLSAGETQAAIEEIESLMEDIGPPATVLSRESKTLFELLAVAYLRLGDEQNRASDPAGASILPLQPTAVHTRPAGSQQAIALYKQIVDRFPEDLQSRWLLNLAYITLGRYPGEVPGDLLIPGLDRSSASGFPRFANVAPARGVDVDGIAGGVSLEDFNEDGFIDILATSRGLNDPLHLFFADGRGGFVDHTAAAGLSGLVGGLNTVHADYNNDGFDDVLIVRGGWLGPYGKHPKSLLRNHGDGTFEDVAAMAGLTTRYPSQTAAWGDFNNDGWIDLFVGNEGGRNGRGAGPCELWLNNRDGTFTEVSARVGLRVFEFVKGVVWGDIDNDGLLDLYVSIIDGPNLLFHNRGGTSVDDWSFEEVGETAGVSEPVASFPVFFWDYNNDGWQDLFVASFDVPRSFGSAGEIAAGYLGEEAYGEKNRVYRNNGDGTFTDVAPDLGLDLSLWTMGLNRGDLNNDGYQDIYVGTGTPDLRSIMPNRMFLNEQGTHFRDVTLDGGFGHLAKGHAIGFADFDRDGDQDVYEVMGGAVEGEHSPNVLFENPGAGGNNAWVVLLLEGRTANRSAIGARIRVTVTEPGGQPRVVHRTVSTGGSFGSSSLQVEMGLGETERIDELRIIWPNAAQSVDDYRNLAVDRYYRIIEGVAPEALPVASVTLGGSRRADTR